MRDWSFLGKKAVYIPLSSFISDDIHVTKTAGELIFDGYEDPILNAANKVSAFTDAPIRKKFAFFYGVSLVLIERLKFVSM